MKKASLALLLLTSLSTSYAKEQKIQHDAHEHGVAEMNIVWEKETLNIELLSPAYNITGFEYQPASHEQEELIEQIEKKLNTPNGLFEFEGASCKAINTKIESPFEDHEDHEAKAKDDHEEHEHEEQKHAKHEEHGTKDKHDDHNDEHKDHESQEKHADHDDHDEHAEDEKSSTHSEYSISYEFSCTNSKAVLSVNASNLFKHFPQLEKVKVQWLSSTQQSSSVLSKKNNTVTLN